MSYYYIEASILEQRRMEMKETDDFKGLFENMNTIAMNLFLDRLVAEFGEERMKAIVEEVFQEAICIDHDALVRRAKQAFDIDEYVFREEIGYMSEEDATEEEVAHVLIMENLEYEFMDDIEILIRMGRDEDLEAYVAAVIEGMEDADGLLTGYSPDSPAGLSLLMRGCMEEGRPLDFFNSW